MSTTLSILGDSVLKGVTLNDKNHYVVNRQLDADITAVTGCPVQNLSRMGFTTDAALARSMVDQLAPCDAERFVLIEFGGNDCDFDWQKISEAPLEEHLCKVPLDRFKENYRKLIRMVKKVKGIPVAMSLVPIDAKRYFSWFCRGGVIAENVMTWLKDINIIYRWQEMYSVAICKLAREERIPLIDLRSPFLEIHNIGEYLSADGIHPSALGQKLLCRTIHEQFPAIPGAGAAF